MNRNIRFILKSGEFITSSFKGTEIQNIFSIICDKSNEDKWLDITNNGLKVGMIRVSQIEAAAVID